MLDANKIYSSLQNQLFELDKDRKWYYNKVKPYKYLFWIPFLTGGIYLLWQINIELNDPPIYMIIGYFIWAFITFILYTSISGLNRKKLKEQFNKQIAPQIIAGLGESFSYEYEGQIPKQEVKETLLFSPFGKYGCQDLVMGVIDDVPIKFGEIKMSNIITKPGNEGRSREEIVFTGFFFSAALKVTFPTRIWLTTSAKTEVSKSCEQKVNIDHPALSKYSVYAEDVDLAKKTLQPFVLERIQALNNKLKKEKVAFKRTSVSFYFADQTVKMAISTHNKFMEPKLSKSINSLKFIEKQTTLLNALSSMVMDLTLK